MREVMRHFNVGGKKMQTYMLAVLALCIVSCSSIDCAMEKSVLCNYQFVNADGEKVSLEGYLTVSTRRVDTEHQDTVLINKLQKASSFGIPMSYSLLADELRFVYANADMTEAIMDEVSVEKTNEPVFESVDCTPRFNHTLKYVSSTHNFIDSIVINNNKVNNDPTKVHLYVYLHSAE